MRVDNLNFRSNNFSNSKAPRYTVELAFDNTSTDLQYFTSHQDTAYPNTVNVIQDVVSGISGTSQTINPDQGLSSIGTIALRLLDKDEKLSTLFNTKLDIGSGLRGKFVKFYMGFAGDLWSDYVLIKTQIIDVVLFLNGVYTIKCADIQRAERKNIFDPVSTTLSQSITPTELLIPVYANAVFELVAHGASYTDAPNRSVFYVKINDEIIRCSGVATDPVLNYVLLVDSLNGRGALNTTATEHLINANLSSNARKTTVEEYIYLELPVAKLIYAILTGNLIGQAGATLPRGWHLNIDPRFVRLSDFTGIGVDRWDVNNDLNGILCVFQGLKKQDAKRFREKELNLLIGCYSPVYSDGALGLKTMTAILSSSDYDLELNEDNVISFESVVHDMQEVRNLYQIDWNYNDTINDFTRTNLLIDQMSIATHGESNLKLLQFKGLDGRRHTQETIFSLFNSLRDRYVAPPIKLKLKCLPSLNVLEVGDVVRVNLKNARDFNGALAPLDRPFEIQGISINWLTGLLSLSLFGSSQKAGALSLGSAVSVVNDSFYLANGIELLAYLDANYVGSYTLSGSVLTITVNVTLTGSNPATIYYYNGNLTIGANVTVAITQTVDIRCRGYLQIDGIINGKGRGLAGIAGVSEYPPVTTGLSGYIGNTRATGGFQIVYKRYYTGGGAYIYDLFVDSDEAPTTFGTVTALPAITLINNTTTDTVLNIPTDLRGTSGGGGGSLFSYYPTTEALTLAALGGDGGNGGAGLITVSRGVGLGVNALIDLSGNDGTQGGVFDNSVNRFYAGSGAGGSGGAWVTILDGGAVAIPDSSKVKTQRGITPHQGFNVWPHGGLVNIVSETEYESFYQSFGVMATLQLFHKVLYIPEDITPVIDEPINVVIAPTNLSLISGDSELFIASDGTVISRIKASWVASVDQNAAGYEVEFKLSSDANYTPASNTINLEISYIYISPVQDGVNYDVRVRAINKYGVRSSWLTLTGYTVIGKLSPPADVDNFLVQRLADGTRSFDATLLNKPLDFAGFEIRAGLGAGLTWEQLTPLHTGLIVSLPWETNQLSAGNYVCGIKGIDTSGNESVNAKIIESTLGDPRISNALITVDFRALAYNGIRSNCWVDPVSGNLVATGANDWSGLPTTWSAWTQWANSFNSTIVYEHQAIDIGVITNVTPLVTVNSNGTSILIEESHSDDNVTFTAFTATGTLIRTRYVKIRITITNTSALPEVTQALVIFDANIIDEQLEDIDTVTLPASNRLGVGDIRLPITKTYSQIKSVQIALQNVTAGWSWVLIDKQASAPRIKIYDSSYVLSDAVIDAVIIGV